MLATFQGVPEPMNGDIKKKEKSKKSVSKNYRVASGHSRETRPKKTMGGVRYSARLIDIKRGWSAGDTTRGRGSAGK